MGGAAGYGIVIGIVALPISQAKFLMEADPLYNSTGFLISDTYLLLQP
jgi:hypothetical protein